MWQRKGQYEYEYDENGDTGWVRCVNGLSSNGHWACWNEYTGQTR